MVQISCSSLNETKSKLVELDGFLHATELVFKKKIDRFPRIQTESKLSEDVRLNVYVFSELKYLHQAQEHLTKLIKNTPSRELGLFMCEDTGTSSNSGWRRGGRGANHNMVKSWMARPCECPPWLTYLAMEGLQYYENSLETMCTKQGPKTINQNSGQVVRGFSDQD